MTPRLDSRTRRAIDRLARQAHAFHRFAHHPLCHRYESELVRLGRRNRVCRGCACAALGVPLGLGAFVMFGSSGPMVLGSLAVGGALALASFLTRLPKGVSRLVPSACSTYALVASSAHRETLALALLVAAGLVGGLIAYRRRGPNRTPCMTCPERTTSTICSGFVPIVRRERAFRRVAERWISRAEVTPGPRDALSARLARPT